MAVDLGAHAILILDQAGWHVTPKLVLALWIIGHPMTLVFASPLDLFAIAGTAFISIPLLPMAKRRGSRACS